MDMYCYFPNKRFWEEKVARVTWCTWITGDFFSIDGDYALLLWEHITAHELIPGQVTAVHCELIEKSFCSPKTLHVIHEFVWKRYTTYTNTVPLWLWSDMVALLKRRVKSVKNTTRSRSVDLTKERVFAFSSNSPTSSQQLIVFPDIWTMHQQLPAKLFDQPGVIRRHSGLSALQKASIFRWCKKWTVHTLITTPAGIFQDRKDLQLIYLVDEHKRRYKSAQDPRYRTPTVLAEMKEVYSCSLISSGMQLFA